MHDMTLLVKDMIFKQRDSLLAVKALVCVVRLT